MPNPKHYHSGDHESEQEDQLEVFMEQNRALFLNNRDLQRLDHHEVQFEHSKFLTNNNNSSKHRI